METSWAEDAAKWAQVGAKLGPCWPKLTPSGADVGAMSDRNNTLVRCCADVENVHVHFLATSPPLPAEAVPVNRGLFESIGSAPKLSPPGPRMPRRHLWCWRIFRHSLSILFFFPYEFVSDLFSGFPLSQVSLAAVGAATSRSRAQAKQF